jgi:3-dehydroquinate dehydratase / shikimate dehydrogenase
VYDPAETRLLQLARERGAEVIPGSEMFVHQAARQFEIWTGKPAPREDMLRIVQVALEERATARATVKTKKPAVVLS